MAALLHDLEHDVMVMSGATAFLLQCWRCLDMLNVWGVTALLLHDLEHETATKMLSSPPPPYRRRPAFCFASPDGLPAVP